MSIASEHLLQLHRAEFDSLALPEVSKHFNREEADAIIANLLFHDSVLNPARSTFFLPPSNPATVVVFGGGVAAGKDYLYHQFLRTNQLPAHAILHDPDLVMGMLSGFQKDAAKDPAAAFLKWESDALRIALEILPFVIAQKRDLVYLRTLSSPFCIGFLKECTERYGYLIQTHLLTCDVERALARAHARAKKEKREVPESEIMKRHQKVSGNFSLLRELSDSLVLWENNAEGDHPEQIARFDCSGEDIVAPKRYEAFLSKAHSP